MIAGHVDLVCKDIRISAAFDVLNPTKAWPGGKAVLVLAGDFAGTAADAVHVMVDKTQLHIRFDWCVCKTLRALYSFPDFLCIFFLSFHCLSPQIRLKLSPENMGTGSGQLVPAGTVCQIGFLYIA